RASSLTARQGKRERRKPMPAIATQDFQCVLYDVRDHICRITLNRPERRNALNPRAYAEGEAVKEMMTGEVRPQTASQPRVRFEPTPAAMAAIECDKPVIAAVNGSAVG